MAHILAKITLKSGAVIKLRAEKVTHRPGSLSWSGERTDCPQVLHIAYDEIAAVTTERKWF
ncbi:hypothetical protein EV379_1225 [Microterricola gilva]|uniref:Uncharacterized protein n=1 Tax=Microterricola gilva TaxID=393267 RepID=A0A4Q8AKC1_9MICO|nr:hypothetical protein [Microterricola gilva]RZU64914.1 hypothetical protein EV379_1225 [Microterricola gilva]